MLPTGDSHLFPRCPLSLLVPWCCFAFVGFAAATADNSPVPGRAGEDLADLSPPRPRAVHRMNCRTRCCNAAGRVKMRRMLSRHSPTVRHGGGRQRKARKAMKTPRGMMRFLTRSIMGPGEDAFAKHRHPVAHCLAGHGPHE